MSNNGYMHSEWREYKTGIIDNRDDRSVPSTADYSHKDPDFVATSFAAAQEKQHRA